MNKPAPANQLVPAEHDGAPSMFNGWQLDMQVIAEGSIAIRDHKMHARVHEMQRCFDGRHVAALKAAIDATDTAATDLQLTLSVLRSNIRRFERVIAVHQARRPR